MARIYTDTQEDFFLIYLLTTLAISLH
jgi:hypothetical protein